MILEGKKVNLRPMTLEELPDFYKWAIQSPFWYGEYSDEKIPTFEEFKNGWKGYYFDGSQPEKGRCFAILANDKVIGEINYNEINRRDDLGELDIIIYRDSDKGKGFGPDALKTLVNWLFSKMNVNRFLIEAVTKNKRAIKAYKKAGFKTTKTFTKNGIEWAHLERWLSRKDL